MSGDASPAFVDTNVLVYALAADDTKRVPVAQKLIRELMLSRDFRTSTQVLQELFVTLTRKVKKPISSQQALRYLDRIAVWPVTVLDYSAVREAIELSSGRSISLWDAPVIVATARSGATRLYTEDLQHGQKLLGVDVVNPFRGS